MTKLAQPDHPILDVIAERWSPYGYGDRPVDKADLASLFEAARWAASSYNEQPWRYIVATRDDPGEFSRLLSCLVEPNQAWARSAPVLALGIASLAFSRNDKPNGAAVHDLGQASAMLSIEATARGLSVHQMKGILPDRARELYGVPEGYEVVTALAIGYAAHPDSQPEDFREADTTPRKRRPLAEFVFAGGWGESADIARKDD
jgi:nitroreductase